MADKICVTLRYYRTQVTYYWKNKTDFFFWIARSKRSRRFNCIKSTFDHAVWMKNPGLLFYEPAPPTQTPQVYSSNFSSCLYMCVTRSNRVWEERIRGRCHFIFAFVIGCKWILKLIIIDQKNWSIPRVFCRKNVFSGKRKNLPVDENEVDENDR